jgi:FkbM family methyltransferase
MKFKDIRRRAERFLKQLCGKDIWIWRNIRVETMVAGKERYVICPKFLSSRSIVYSAGIGDDISFDIELIKNFGCSVFGFDPSPSSIAWVEKYNLPIEFRFYPYGISDHDGEALMYPPENPDSTSFSLVCKKTSSDAFEVPVRCLTSIMRELGHTHIDLLKLDIEGGEYAVIEDMIQREIRPGQIIVEFHHRFPEIGLSMTKKAIRELKKAGYRIFYIDPKGEEFSFIHRNLISMEKQSVIVAQPEI